MNEVYFKIADIIIKIVSPFLFVTDNGKDFLCEKTNEDYTFYFKPHNNIQEFIKDSQMVADLLWAHEYIQKDGTYLRAFLWKEHFYPAVTIMGKDVGTCYYATSDILAEKAEEGFELWMYLCLEQILLQKDALVLHSSHINVNGKGIVFSAPSGTGKSTQAELWNKYANAFIVNGDRSVLRKKDGIWHVYGCPMCGTSGIHKQGNEPLSNIIMLSKGTENSVQKMHGMSAFRKIYPEITCSLWNPKFVNHVINLLSELLTQVPIWHYSCTKESDSVYCLKKALNIID